LDLYYVNEIKTLVKHFYTSLNVINLNVFFKVEDDIDGNASDIISATFPYQTPELFKTVNKKEK